MVLPRGSGGRDTGSTGSVIAGSCCLLLALGSAHRAFAGPDHANLVIPPDAPSMQSFEAATLASVDAYYAPFCGLSALLDGSGNPVSISTNDGTTAYAYLDGAGNVIIAYRWDITQQQEDLATATLSGYDPGTLPGYAEALAFERTVQALAMSQGYPASRIYLTGFSLGGMQASYVASQTGCRGWRSVRAACRATTPPPSRPTTSSSRATRSPNTAPTPPRPRAPSSPTPTWTITAW